MPGVDEVVTASKIISHVCKQLGVTRKMFRGKRKNAPVVFAKMLTAHTLRHCTEMTLEEIGELVGCRHSSVIYYCDSIDLLLENNPIAINKIIEEAKDECKGDNNNTQSN